MADERIKVEVTNDPEIADRRKAAALAAELKEVRKRIADRKRAKDEKVPDPSREELISLCERASIPQTSWWNRDSARAQRQVGELWALLRAGCDFRILHEVGGLNSDGNTWWVEVEFEGFNFKEMGEQLDTDSFYLPTEAKLARVNGDWY